MRVPVRPFLRRSAVLLAVVLALSTASCGSGSESGTATQTSAPEATVTRAAHPEEERIVAIVRSKLAELDLSGVVYGVWRDGEELAVGALGQSPIGVPATPDMQVRVGQPMESMLSTVLLQLDEEGVVGLDEPVATWVPDFPRADTITPRMLANGTSGIADYVTDPEFLKQFYANPIAGFTAQQLFDLANLRPPLFEPGTNWAYAHSDLVLLGEVLQNATGKPLGELLRERIFEPLDMRDSQVELTPQIAEPTLHGYTNERGVFEDSTNWNPTAFLHSGNMNSTVAEIARWVEAVADGEVLSDAAHTEMMAASTAGLGPLTDEKFFAYGVVHLDGWLYMNPSFGGYNGVALHDTVTKTTIILYSSLGPTANANTNNVVPIGAEIGALLVPDRAPQVS